MIIPESASLFWLLFCSLIAYDSSQFSISLLHRAEPLLHGLLRMTPFSKIMGHPVYSDSKLLCLMMTSRPSFSTSSLARRVLCVSFSFFFPKSVWLYSTYSLPATCYSQTPFVVLKCLRLKDSKLVSSLLIREGLEIWNSNSFMMFHALGRHLWYLTPYKYIAFLHVWSSFIQKFQYHCKSQSKNYNSGSPDRSVLLFLSRIIGFPTSP